MALSANAIDTFVRTGFVKISGAFPRLLADACREELWRMLELARDRPETWTRPVVRVDGSAAPVFAEAANTRVLTEAFDQLVGPGRWRPRRDMGTFPVRFPSNEDPGDAGWHVDGSYFEGDDLLLNSRSRERALLMLFLFSDVAEADAPTRIRVGSHRLVPPVLEAAGESGTSFTNVVGQLDEPAGGWRETLATGEAGDVFLCHPFLVHAASWPHRGLTPRFLGQPCLYPSDARGSIDPDRPEQQRSAVERAVM